MGKKVKLNEAQLRNFISNAIKEAVKQSYWDERGVGQNLGYEAFLAARKIELRYNELVKMAQNLMAQNPETGRYKEIVEKLKAGWQGIQMLALYDRLGGGNEGRGFGTDGVRAF